jgi:RNA polymerase sigma factor (sigma-70 family)
VTLHDRLELHREHLFRVCYRMTGSTADAEDLVQEAFRRVLERPPADLERDLRAWLVRVAVNLGRDALRARKRRGYIGTWLPAPYETPAIPDRPSETKDPEARYGEVESVTFAFLLALEALTANQRAVLLLRDVLDYSGQETATALGLSEANVKTTLHRARAAMASYDASRVVITPELERRTRAALEAFCLHLATRNVAALEALLSRDVRARNDGDGEFFAARKPVLGLAKVIRFHLNVMPRARGSWQRAAGQPRVAIRSINGLPALVSEMPAALRAGVATRGVLRVELAPDGTIMEVDTIVATAKLRAIDFAGLHRASWRDLLSMLWAALWQPPLHTWLLPAARRAWTGLRALRDRN